MIKPRKKLYRRNTWYCMGVHSFTFDTLHWLFSKSTARKLLALVVVSFFLCSFSSPHLYTSPWLQCSESQDFCCDLCKKKTLQIILIFIFLVGQKNRMSPFTYRKKRDVKMSPYAFPRIHSFSSMHCFDNK